MRREKNKIIKKEALNYSVNFKRATLSDQSGPKSLGVVAQRVTVRNS